MQSRSPDHNHTVDWRTRQLLTEIACEGSIVQLVPSGQRHGLGRPWQERGAVLCSYVLVRPAVVRGSWLEPAKRGLMQWLPALVVASRGRFQFSMMVETVRGYDLGWYNDILSEPITVREGQLELGSRLGAWHCHEG